jgi:hypothetical protein
MSTENLFGIAWIVENHSARRKKLPVPVFPPKIPNKLAWD